MKKATKIMNTEFGGRLSGLVKTLDTAIQERAETSEWREPGRYGALDREIHKMMDQLEVYKLAIKTFCDLEVCFTRTDEYFGLCTEDESFYLMKIEREAGE